MNSNILNFFTKASLFTIDECSQIDVCCSVSYIKNIERNLFTINFRLHKLFPISLYRKVLSVKYLHRHRIEMNISNTISVFDTFELFDYVLFACDEYKINPEIFKRMLKFKSFEIKGEIIVFKYLNKEELLFLNNNKDKLLQFLNTAGFCIIKIELVLDEEQQDILASFEVKKREREKMIHRIKRTDSSITKAEVENKIVAKNLISLSEISSSVQSGVIQGEIFKIQVNKMKNSGKIYLFYITDFVGAIVVKAFLTTQTSFINKYKSSSFLPDFYLSSFKKGDWVKVSAYFSVDKYQNNDITGVIKQIEKVEGPESLKREDKEDKKRVELVCHTKMTAFDGIASTEEIIDRCDLYKWAAVSITDRYNVQSFIDAYTKCKKTGKKIIYGSEFNLLRDNPTLCINPRETTLNNMSYIVFDIETTGIYNEFEDLIEFAGVKVTNGIIIDRLSFLIKPSKSIPFHITELTHITNEMVLSEGLDVKEALIKIQSWIGDDILIAHNGIKFDFRFLNKKLEQQGLPLLTNPLIDTMQISRFIHEKSSKHNLGALSRFYKLSYTSDVAHRADFDVDVLLGVWLKMLSKLLEVGIVDLNQLYTLSSESYWSKQFADNFVILYCKDQNSIKVLYEAISTSLTTDLYSVPRLFKTKLDKIRNSFIVANSPVEGEVFDAAFNGTDEQLCQCINSYDYIFVASPRNVLHDIERKFCTLKEVQNIIKKIINFSNKLNKKVVAVSDAYYLDLKDKAAHAVYVNSKLLGGKSHRLFRYGQNNSVLPDYHLRTTKEMLDEFSFLEDKELINQIVIDNSVEFASLVSGSILPIPSGLHSPKVKDSESNLVGYVSERGRELYGSTLDPIVSERIKKELESIIKNEYTVIYWIAHLLVNQSLSDGYLVGSRGSVGSSLIAFLLNITEVNPLPAHYLCNYCQHIEFHQECDDGFDLPNKNCPKCNKLMVGDGHNIPFETFLGFKGEKIPDIDLNFSSDYQSTAHDFIRKMFGDEHTFRAGTISTVATKTAFGYVKNYFEQHGSEQDNSLPYVEYVVSKCEGVKRTTGQHPGGIIIIPKDRSIFEFTPYNFPADEKSGDWYTTHFPFKSLHDNLLKFDILGHEDPKKLKMLEKLTGVDPKTIPNRDEKVLKLFSSSLELAIKDNSLFSETTGAVGLPEFGTDFVRKILVDSQPSCFADLIRISGLSHGENVWANNAKDLIKSNHMELSQVVSCRDDIMTYLIEKGVDAQISFSVMESVRKGKGISANDLDILKLNNVPEWYISSCQKILYLFPKAHATAYVLMAWRIAWFKIYHPLAFYATIFSITPHLFDVKTIIAGPEAISQKLNDIRIKMSDRVTKTLVKKKEEDLVWVYEIALELFARGYRIVNVDLNKSQVSSYIIEGDCIIPPFVSIDGLGEAVALSIVAARNAKPFSTKEDLLERTGINKTVIVFMEELGITKELKDKNQLSLFDF